MPKVKISSISGLSIVPIDTHADVVRFELDYFRYQSRRLEFRPVVSRSVTSWPFSRKGGWLLRKGPTTNVRCQARAWAFARGSRRSFCGRGSDLVSFSSRPFVSVQRWWTWARCTYWAPDLFNPDWMGFEWSFRWWWCWSIRFRGPKWGSFIRQTRPGSRIKLIR